LGNRVKTIVDQILQNLVAIEETRSLLIWLRNNDYDQLGVTGYSMGGYMAAIASQLVSFPLAVTPCATGHSVMYPLIRSPLNRLVDWKALGAELSKPYNARSTLARLFARVCIPNLGQLNDDSSAVIVGNKYDEFIDAADIKKLHSHWKNSRLRWVPAGHTTGWFLKRRDIRKAISDSFEKLIHG
jgi:esterase/lipase